MAAVSVYEHPRAGTFSYPRLLDFGDNSIAYILLSDGQLIS